MKIFLFRLTVFVFLGLTISVSIAEASSAPIAVKDIAVGEMVDVNGTLFMYGDDGINGAELWRSDGTSDGTTLVKDIQAGAVGSTPTRLFSLNNILYFFADDGIHGQELWRSDGTELGTTMVKDINLGLPARIVAGDSFLYFIMNAGSGYYHLYKSDGTSEGTTILKDNITNTTLGYLDLIFINGLLYFTNGNSSELWIYNGVDTIKLKDIASASGSYPEFTKYNNSLFFFGSHGLWRSDGTAGNTIMVKDLENTSQKGLAKAGDLLYFLNYGGTGDVTLNSYNGLTSEFIAGKHFYFVDIHSFYSVEVGNELYFSITHENDSKKSLYKSDGTYEGTVLIRDMQTGFDKIGINNMLYFSGTDNRGAELWSTDGTNSGTNLVYDLRSGADSSWPSSFTTLDNYLYFTAYGSFGNQKLYKKAVYHNLNYLTEGDGYISGQLSQIVNDGYDGSMVVANANVGSYFVGWSDGATSTQRYEQNVIDDLSITANFATSSANYYFLPSSGTYEVGTPIDIQVLITANTPFNSIGGFISIDDSQLQVNSISETGSILNLWTVEPSYSEALGGISFNGGIPSSATSGLVFTFNLEAISPGVTTIQFQNSNVFSADGLGTPMATSSDDVTLVFTADVSAPSIPSSLTAQAISASQINLSWNQSTDNLAVAGYKIYRNNLYIASTSSTAYSDTGLSASTRYDYTILSYDVASNESAKSATSSATTIASHPGGGGGGGAVTPRDTTPPTTPVDFSGIRGNGLIKLNWTNPIVSDFDKVIIIRDTKTINNKLPGVSLKNKKTFIYEGNLNTFEDKSVLNNEEYYYAISAYDKSGNYSDIAVLFVSKQAEELMQEPVEEKVEVLGVEHVDYSGYKSLYGLDKELVEAISIVEAELVFGKSIKNDLNEANKKIYDKLISAKSAGLSDAVRYAIAYFIQVGTPTTNTLGAGERAGALNSYAAAFGSFPETIAEWQDVIKIANGRWPQKRNAEKEQSALAIFKKIYLRNPDRTNANDDTAVTIIAYGLRPANRNMGSEKAAINSFRHIYKYEPSSALDWDIIRAIAYGGAKR